VGDEGNPPLMEVFFIVFYHEKEKFPLKYLKYPLFIIGMNNGVLGILKKGG
jgi:hypothetical protein